MEKAELIQEINRLRKEKNAVIMAHYYQEPDIQEIADHIGDSLALAQLAARTEASIIVLCGVHFMGETAKIISPDKKVLIPDATAGCSLADSCSAKHLEAFIQTHPGHKVISYVNTSAAVKALTDVVVTSSNAVQIVNSFPKDEKIIFGPDHNLGDYINRLTGRKMLLWDGACHVHEQFSSEGIRQLKAENPTAKVIAHPECKKDIIDIADYAGSTAGLIKYVQKSESDTFIVVTESGVLFEMQRLCPDKHFLPAPPEGNFDHPLSRHSKLNVCNYMRQNTLEKLYLCLRDENPEISIDAEIAAKAILPIQKMLDISARLGL